eukprot:3332644-Amphidinium_carterae.1
MPQKLAQLFLCQADLVEPATCHELAKKIPRIKVGKGNGWQVGNTVRFGGGAIAPSVRHNAQPRLSEQRDHTYLWRYALLPFNAFSNNLALEQR